MTNVVPWRVQEGSAPAIIPSLSSKTSIDSLPDEMLARIVQEVAGFLEYDEMWRGYTRTPDSNADLRSLRLVNIRLSGMAQREMYRAPGTLANLRCPLSRTTQHILLHPLVGEVAQMLSLAGDAGLFADLLEGSFFNLTSLALVFTVPTNLDASDVDQLSHLSRRYALDRMRKAIQRLSLKNLYLYFRPDFHALRVDFSRVVLMAAGHPTLRHFTIDGLNCNGTTERERAIRQDRVSPFLSSLDIRNCSKQQIQILHHELGSMPLLSRIKMQCSQPGRDNDLVHTLEALRSDVKGQILNLTLSPHAWHAQVWQNLAGYHDLRRLNIHFKAGSAFEVEFSDIVLPNLETLVVECYRVLPFAMAALKQAAKRHLLPSLRSLELYDLYIQPRPWEKERTHALLTAYDEFVACNTEIRITPPDIRETVARQLEKLENSSDGETATDTSESEDSSDSESGSSDG